MNFPEKEIMIDSTFGSRMYLTQDIEAWRTDHAGKLADPPRLLSITLTDLTKLNDWLRTLIEECLR